jgi:hypothetical protein
LGYFGGNPVWIARQSCMFGVIVHNLVRAAKWAMVVKVLQMKNKLNGILYNCALISALDPI